MNAHRCSFCRKLSYVGKAALDPVFDKAIWEDDDFVLMPTVGALVPGYLLLLPRRHYSSLGNLPDGLLRKAAALKDGIRRLLTAQFTAPVFFEHGDAGGTGKSGSSVTHAHLHCVPTDVDITSALRQENTFARIQSITDLAGPAAAKRGYIYYESQIQEQYLLCNADVPSQYVRRVLACGLSVPGRWDWRAFPMEENVAATRVALMGADLGSLKLRN